MPNHDCSVHFHRQSKKVERDEDVVSTHWVGKRFPSAWARIVYAKRAMPRWIVFPLIFILTLAINAIWVIPVTLTYMRSCNSVTADDMCITWAAEGPNSSWYNPSQVPYDMPNTLYRLYRPASTTLGDYDVSTLFNDQFSISSNVENACPGAELGVDFMMEEW